MAVLGAPVFPHGNLAFFVAIFSEMTRLSAGVGLRLLSIHPSITRESKWRYIMKKINLRELYRDVYTTDFFVDVTEEVMETIRAAERAEAAYERKMYRYKAQYSLDCENGIENAVLLKPQTPEIVLEEKQFQEQVYAAVMRLPEKQAKRIYETRFLAVGKTDISPPISESI
jgi:RNA polymerase sigma-70 factor (ECF subfamily)